MESWKEQMYQNELQHHGILGMHWGIRRYQNSDGTLTAEGKQHIKKERKPIDKEKLKRIGLKVGKAVGIAAGAYVGVNMGLGISKGILSAIGHHSAASSAVKSVAKKGKNVVKKMPVFMRSPLGNGNGNDAGSGINRYLNSTPNQAGSGLTNQIDSPISKVNSNIDRLMGRKR